jgi:hypothetical protein
MRQEYNALYFAFSCTFCDLVRRGLITGDQNLLDQFWRDFLRDLHKYPSKLAHSSEGCG